MSFTLSSRPSDGPSTSSTTNLDAPSAPSAETSGGAPIASSPSSASSSPPSATGGDSGALAVTGRPSLFRRFLRPFQDLRLRLSPARHERTVGPFSRTVARSDPPPTPDKPRPVLFKPTAKASARSLQAADAKARAAARSTATLLTKQTARSPEPAAASATTSPPTQAPAIAALIGASVPGLPAERALLLETVLETATSDRTQTAEVLAELLRTPAPTLTGVRRNPITGGASQTPATVDVQRQANAARRALAATASGFDTLVSLQGLRLPPAGDPMRPRAELALEQYKLGLRAEDALIAQGLRVGGAQSSDDVRDALDAHPRQLDLLDPTWLGTGNARRRPGGAHEAELPSTLAAQAFLHATANQGRAADLEGEAMREYKPAYVALRNGFTVSGQGSDFHLMAKRLRKFVRYIDLACKTPDGELPTTRHRLSLPLRFARRLAGKDKSPLATLLKSGAIGSSARIVLADGRAIDPTGERQELQDAFQAASPAQRRDLLRQIVVATTAGGASSYTDGRRHAVGFNAGYGGVSVAGVGGLSTGITPVIDISAERNRTAVFRGGTLDTGVLYLGSERKVSGSVGVGVRAGTQIGPVLNVSAQAMARLGASHLVSRGLMIRTRPDGREHESLPPELAKGLGNEGWKRMNELAVNAIFDIADQSLEKRPAQGGAMWSQVVDRLGDFRDISFGWNEGRATTVDVSASLDATAAIQVFPGVGASASAGVGLKHTLLDRKQARDVGGAARSAQTERASRTALRLGAGAGLSHPSLGIIGGRNIAALGRYRVGVETELVLQSRSGMVRIATLDGQVQPNLSARHREFGVRDDFIQAMNAQRQRWVERLGQPDATGRPQDGDRRFGAFMTELVNLDPGPGRFYLERQCLTAEAAQAIGSAMDRLAVLQRARPAGTTAPGPGEASDTDARVAELQALIAERIESPGSWQPAGLNVIQPIVQSSAPGASIDASASANAGGGSWSDRLLGGGRLAVGGRIEMAAGGRALLSLDATSAAPLAMPIDAEEP